MLISVDNASFLWVSFYKILKVSSVPLEFNYLAIVNPPISALLVREGREKRLLGEGYKTVNKKRNVKISKGGGYTKGEREGFVYRRKQ